MRTIQKYLPQPYHSESIRIFVKAKPDVAWEAARHHNMSSIPWVNFLFKLRTFTDLFKNQKPVFGDTGKGIIDEIAQHNKGFLILEERPGKDVVVGAIGKFWHIDIPFKNFTPEDFQSFRIPGWGKVAWSISVEPYLEGSTICFDLRTAATDKTSWLKLNRYYHIIGQFSKLIRYSLMKNLEKDLCKLMMPDDTKRYVAGDDIIPDARYIDTDQIDIEAPVSIVWAYLMQLGCDRAGWYSVDLLDNGNRKSTDHIVHEWSDRKIGDRLSATPDDEGFFEVYQMESEKYFVIGGAIIKEDQYFKSTWAFELSTIGEDATRLTVRARMKMSTGWKEWLMGNIYYPLVHGLMESVQLKTIRRYAERDANSRMLQYSF